MNRNAVIGFALVVAAGALACVFASACGSAVRDLFGKAVWYLPYVATVCGVRRLRRAR